MAASDRPSGLTALAVINCILAFMQVLEVGGLLMNRYAQAPGFARNEEMPQTIRDAAADLLEVPHVTIALLCILLGLSGLFLFCTVFGYWKRKRFWGRHLTTAYAACDLTYVVCICALMPESFVRSLGISLIRTAFYPLFLGTVIHTVFRRDLVR